MTTAQNSYRGVIIFLVKFIGIYLVGNVSYGLFIEYYAPSPDPVTYFISENVVALLNLFDESITISSSKASPYVSFVKENKTIINVFEGCNGLNVMIVYFSFLVAFKGKIKQTLVFACLGLVIIYVMNLFRVGALYEVALHFPAQLYFFHKYFFTALLYLAVFILWYFWVKQTSRA